MSIQHYKLGDLASVQLGYSFRSRIERADSGRLAVIQMKDMTDDHRIATSDMTRINADDIKEHHLVQKNDIIFRSRGYSTTAAFLDGAVGSTVIAAPLMRIRIVKDVVLPEYLCWFINLSSTQSVLAKQARGSLLRMVGKDAVANLEVIVPSIEQQRAIVEIARLSRRELDILNELIVKRKVLIEKELKASLQ